MKYTKITTLILMPLAFVIMLGVYASSEAPEPVEQQEPMCSMREKVEVFDAGAPENDLFAPYTLAVAPIAKPVEPPKYRTVRARVTACSPNDPKGVQYYAAHGYEGRLTNAACADPRMLPLGTKIIVPGYANNTWVPIDAKGGSVIRRSTRRGVVHLDIKFKSYQSAKQWGSKTLLIQILEK